MGKRHKLAYTVLICVSIVSITIALILWGAFRKSADKKTIVVSADAYIVDSQKDKSHNGSTLTISDGQSSCSTAADCTKDTSYAYLKFNIQKKQKDNFNSVKLRVYTTNPSADGGQIYTSDSTWNEGSLNWDNAPDLSEFAVGSFAPMPSEGWYETDIPYTLFRKNGNFTFVIASKDSNRLSFASKEDVKHQPQLFFSSIATEEITDQTKSTIVTAGDIACDEEAPKYTIGDDCKQKDVSDLIADENPSSILLLGDIQYETGSYEKFLKYFDTSWGRFRDKFKPTPGNHEYLNSSYNTYLSAPAGCETTNKKNPFSYACGYFDYFNGKSTFDGPAGMRGEGYYAYNQGSWRVYAVNSNCTFGDGCATGSKQEQWLRSDLAAHPRQCKLMFMHHPIVSSDSFNFDMYLPGLPDPIWYARVKENIQPLKDIYKAFYDYGGDLVLAGHSHLYERFDKQDLNHKADDKGFTEIVVGTGGRYTYNPDEKHIRPLSVVRSKEGDKGLLRLDLDKNNFSWSFKSVPGKDFTDSGTQTCNYANQ